MNAVSHFTLGLLLAKLLKLDIVGAALLIFGALIPDVDYPHSVAGRKTPLSGILNFIFGHRGFIHTVWPALVLYTISKPVAFGYASHLLLDMTTVGGVAPFFPLLNFRLRGPIKSHYIFDIIASAAFVAIAYLIK